ncbi:zinc finger protein 43 isoform X10 [Amyelois transitella]|uniref:zinc finger protein 43 isoform X10 n=1 Tax=Amyelois transitella TaxID=680683 RepID=UPI00298FB625|nr:zinc finger protein 43 isoform X10 [Amyelois transitella]
MAAKSEWRPGPTVCRCCLTEGCYKDISTEYFWMGKREVYAEMLKDTLEVTIAYSKAGGPNSNSRLICESCISRLRDATEFKRQVVECERMFMQHLDPGSSSAAIEAETEPVGKIKVEGVKLEKSNSDDDFDNRHAFGDDDDDDDDDLDNQPLTKLASKMPTKESVDLLDLLDNSKTAEKRKSSTKVKPPPPKKAKSKVEQVKVKPSGSKLTPKPEKKKKGEAEEAKRRQGPLTSLWEMTVSERHNAALILENTTAKPFVYCRYFFKCFFCHAEYSEIRGLLDHSAVHDIPEHKSILKNLLPKGKRTVKVDISELKCRICSKGFDNLDLIRQHLTQDHDKPFTQSGNGIIAYNLTTKNGQFSCHICNRIFQTFILLNRHMNVHFSNAVCETCGAGFLTHQRLIQHKEIHAPGGYPCNKCNKIYTTQSNLKHHVEKTHEGATKMRMLRCPHCEERFTEHFRKLKHLKAVHGITFTYECEICKAVYPSRRSLTMHTNKYHTQKTLCEICKKSFSCVTTLKKHMICHTGERNFVCSFCQKAYRHQKSLKQHLRSHYNGGELRYRCNECDIGFGNRDEYNKHVREWHNRTFFNFAVD